MKYLSRIKKLHITAAFLIKTTDGFDTIRKLRKSDDKVVAQKITALYNKLVNEHFWFLPSKKFWSSYLSLKEKILSYFKDFPGDYYKMIEIPEEFVMSNVDNLKPPSITSEESNDREVENTVENTMEEDNMIEPEEKDDLYDVIPLITPCEKVVRVVVKFEKDDSLDETKERTRKLVDAIEKGDLDYKCLPKEQVILYENEEENRKAMQFLKIDRQVKEERKFTETTFNIKSLLSGKLENIDFKAVFNCFEELKLIKYSATLLLKHSNCVLVIKNCREFDFKKSKKSGSLENKKLKIRIDCKKLYIYYKSFFPFLPKVKNFWKEYVECKSKFDEILSNMTKDDRACVTDLPSELLEAYA